MVRLYIKTALNSQVPTKHPLPHSHALLCCVAGARVSTELLAPAPAPAASKPVADLLFTLSAANATFSAADRLELSGLQTTAQAFNTETRATGIYGLGALLLDS